MYGVYKSSLLVIKVTTAGSTNMGAVDADNIADVFRLVLAAV
jgi:hypothetical protein